MLVSAAGFAVATAALWIAGAVGPLVPLVTLGLCVAVIAVGNFWLPSGVFGRVLLAGPPDQRAVALTFDDGPDPKSTPQVLDVLAQHGARATFFVIGARAAQHPDLLREIAQRGHQIENHSLHHAWRTPFLPRRWLAQELAETQAIIRRATGRTPTWFRPPIGILSPPVAAAAAQLGLRLCGWSGKSRDGLASTRLSDALGRLRRALRPGAILLLHDASERGTHPPLAPTLLAQLLPELHLRGLAAVTLDELLRDG